MAMGFVLAHSVQCCHMVLPIVAGSSATNGSGMVDLLRCCHVMARDGGGAHHVGWRYVAMGYTHDPSEGGEKRNMEKWARLEANKREEQHFFRNLTN